MIFKALIFDLDGTVVPSRLDGMPSSKVVEAVHKLSEKFILSSASGRPAINCENIWKVLELKAPCIVNGGSQIVDPKTGEIIWEKCLSEISLRIILRIAQGYVDKVAINENIIDPKNIQEKFSTNVNIIVIYAVRKDTANEIVRKLAKMHDIASYILPSWTEGDYWDIHITHIMATKKYAVKELIKILGLRKEDVIGVGDGNNDLPLFEEVGYKIAMGNAESRLKEASDYIVDSIENDGFAKIIDNKL